MIGNKSFQRKIIYVVLIAGLLIPVSLLSRPATRQPDGTIAGGGTLAQMRDEYSLSMANLGEIDPTSESMKLATLGMRGIAANLLWGRANKFKREQDWDNLAATLNQMSKLQPRFISVWQFQGWNLAYNVSVEFDDYRSRYHWVKRGINFLRQGVTYNEHEPVLFWELGWTFGHKIGRADEQVQYRRLFRNDEDFHRELSAEIPMDVTLGPDNRPDNWLAGRQYFLRGQREVDSGTPIRGRLVDNTGRIKRGKTPLIFHSHPPKWIMSYATAIESEGYLGETAQIAWRDGGIQWNEYGNRELGSSLGFTIRLNDVEALQPEVERLQKELDEYVGQLYVELAKKKKAELPEPDRIALDTPTDQRTTEQEEMAKSAAKKIEVTYEEAARLAPSNVRAKALRMARRLKHLKDRIEAADINRQQVAYVYWRFRCQIEQTDTAIAARRHIYNADKAYEQADLLKMKEEYELAWEKWGEIFEQHPMLLETPDADDLYEAINRYRDVLRQLDLPFPPPGFKLEPIVEFYDEDYVPVAKRGNQRNTTSSTDSKDASTDSGKQSGEEEPSSKRESDLPAKKTDESNTGDDRESIEDAIPGDDSGSTAEAESGNSTSEDAEVDSEIDDDGSGLDFEIPE